MPWSILVVSKPSVSLTNPRIGINEMIISVPSLGVKAEEIVRAFHRNNTTTMQEQLEETIKNDIGKMTAGLGIKQSRLPGYSESNVTFVANAIYEFIKKVTSNEKDLAKLRAEPVRNIYYASESNPDRSRPEVEQSFLLVYSKLLDEDTAKYREIVEMFKNSTLVPVTFACAGGGIALVDAISNVYLSIGTGTVQSALVITADTAIYDNDRAPNAEFTQGAGAALLWITKDPELASVIYQNGSGNFHMPLSDFTKFGEEMPLVHGKFSERTYVYTIAKSLEMLEKNSKGFSLNEMAFFVTHVPFPKQSIYFASFLFAHVLKTYHKALFEELQKRPDLGEEKLCGSFKITDLMDKKFASFNSVATEKAMQEHDIIQYIENDPEIDGYWNWLKKLRNQKEFEEFVTRLHIKSALILPAEVGNSYSSSAFVGFASLIKNATALHDGKPKIGILSFYGSGAIARSIPIEVTAESATIARRLTLIMPEPIQIDYRQYAELHPELIKGDASRTINRGDLIEKDKKFLVRSTLGKGFHIRRRNPNGTGEYVYSDGEKITPLIIRF